MGITQITLTLQFFVLFVDQINYFYILLSEFDYILNMGNRKYSIILREQIIG